MLASFQINYLSARSHGNRNPYDDQVALLEESTEAAAVTSKSARGRVLQLVDLVLNALVFSPLVMIYWVSTWDIIFLHIYPSNLVASYSCTIVIANAVILSSYFLAERLQRYHDRLRSHFDSTSIDDPTERPHSYYGKDFLFRLVYIYFVTVSYVFQWRAFWDLFNFFTSEANYGYFVAISTLALLAHRLILRKSFGACIKTTPFFLRTDTTFDDFFLQKTSFPSKNRYVQIIGSYLFNEFVEMGISVIMWKGIYDLFDLGSLRLAAGSRGYSLLITGAIGYTIYVAVLALDAGCMRHLRRPQSTYFKEALYFVAYFGMVAIWRTAWVGFDLLILDLDSSDWLVFVVHYAALGIASLLKLMSSLVGPSA